MFPFYKNYSFHNSVTLPAHYAEIRFQNVLLKRKLGKSHEVTPSTFGLYFWRVWIVTILKTDAFQKVQIHCAIFILPQ